jgi:hypothetical protein
MKKLTFILTIIISFIFINSINVYATSICDNKEMLKGGFCKLQYDYPVATISHYSNQITDSNGKTLLLNTYNTTINGNTQELFCLDPNLKSPNPVRYARPLKIESNASDVAYYQVYAQYIINGGKSLNEKNILAVNIASRALAAMLSPGDLDADIAKKWVNVANTLGDNKIPYSGYPTIKSDIDLVRKYYCPAIVACHEAGMCKTIKGTACASYASKVVPAKTYDVKFKPVQSKIETTETDDGKFTKKVPIKVTGLKDIKTAMEAYPSIKASLTVNISCEDSQGLTCSFADDITESTNLIDKLTVDEDGSATFYVNVEGDSANFKEATDSTIKLTYKFSYPLSSANLAVLQYDTSSGVYQKLLIYLADNSLITTLKLSIKMPTTCTYNPETGTYKVGGKTVSSVTEYINEGCCADVQVDKLTDDELETYRKTCKLDDIVKLVQDCGTTCDDTAKSSTYSESLVKQVSLDDILVRAKKIDDNYSKGLYDSSSAINDQNTNLNEYYTDQTFRKTYELDLDNNIYCNIYTSENDNIFYPGTTVAASGRFFVFGKDSSGVYGQPRIETTISSAFHYNYTMWAKDYKTASEDEVKYFELAQKSEAAANAINNVNTESKRQENVFQSNKLQYISEDGKTTCNYHYYTASTDADTYYNADGTVISYSTYKIENDIKNDLAICPSKAESESVDDLYSEYNPDAEDAYKTAQNKRTTLILLKNRCNKAFDAYNKEWTLNQKPSLTFSYKQYGEKDNKNSEIVTNETLQIDKESGESKFWPGASTDPTPSENSETVIAEANEDSISLKYGKDNEEHLDEDGQKIYKVTADSLKAFDQTLYYKPTTHYYSIIPTGEFVTSNENIESPSIDVGEVFNVSITNYKGEYSTWWKLENIGHLGYGTETSTTDKTDNSNKSNTQKRIDEYLAKNEDYTKDPENNNSTTDSYYSTCSYCDREVLYSSTCTTCPDDSNSDNNKFKPEYIYRTVSTTDLDPNERTLGANWTDAKGESAREQIESLSNGNGLSAYVDSNIKKLSTYDNVSKVSFLNETNEKEASVKQVADTTNNGDIYDDASKTYLEYEFNLSTTDMQNIHLYNKKMDYDYTKMNFKNDNPSDNQFTFKCNKMGKECESSFVTYYAVDKTGLLGRNKWKYYVDGKWCKGTVSSCLGEAGYPSFTDVSYTYWP